MWLQLWDGPRRHQPCVARLGGQRNSGLSPSSIAIAGQPRPHALWHTPEVFRPLVFAEPLPERLGATTEF